jgi:putative hydrolase of the HAD superfamily
VIRKEKIEHIYFDLDDTLWDFEKNSARLLRNLYDELNLKEKLHCDFETYLAAYKKKNNELWQEYNQKHITKEELRKRRFYETFLGFGLKDFDLSWQVSESYIQRSPFGKELKKGSIELLDRLSVNYNLHIITNGFKEVQLTKIEQCGLQKYFDLIIISEDIGFNKPDVRIFREAERLGNTSKESCLMIGDNFNTDITGAKKAGWQSIWYNPEQNKRYQATQVNCLTELMDVL